MGLAAARGLVVVTALRGFAVPAAARGFGVRGDADWLSPLGVVALVTGLPAGLLVGLVLLAGR